METVLCIFAFIIGFIVGLKIGKRPKKDFDVNLWDRELSRDEIETLYKAEKIKEDSLG